jgi:hypothetical protein
VAIFVSFVFGPVPRPDGAGPIIFSMPARGIVLISRAYVVHPYP